MAEAGHSGGKKKNRHNKKEAKNANPQSYPKLKELNINQQKNDQSLTTSPVPSSKNIDIAVDKCVLNTIANTSVEPTTTATNCVSSTITEPVMAPTHIATTSNCVSSTLEPLLNINCGIQETDSVLNGPTPGTVNTIDTSGAKGQKKGQDGDKKGAAKASEVTVINKDLANTATEPPKSKAELRAERRATQEAQRAAKAAGGSAAAQKSKPDVPAQTKSQQPSHKPDTVATASQPPNQANKKPVTKTTSGGQTKKPDALAAPGTGSKEYVARLPNSMQVDDDRVVKRVAKRLEKQGVPNRTISVQKKVGLFRHLQQSDRTMPLTKEIEFKISADIHPAFLKIGVQIAEGVICGSNARCVALLAAMKQAISDYSTPPNSELSRDLEVRIRPYISFVAQCRPLSVSMGNAIKHVKQHITHIPSTFTDEEAKTQLCEDIDTFIHQKIRLAAEAISNALDDKIHNGDAILVYSCSSLIRRVLCDAFDRGKKFTVIVADGRPKLEGRVMLRRLVDHGIKCSYILINSVPYVMKEVTKVFLGAHALLTNGSVMSRCGSSQVALIAKTFNVPVLVCCETYKFCERVQTDSFVFNELGDPDDLVKVGGHAARGILTEWRTIAPLNILNLIYDVTPPELVAMVVTEIGMIPCTSVPVVLRVKYTDT